MQGQYNCSLRSNICIRATVLIMPSLSLPLSLSLSLSLSLTNSLSLSLSLTLFISLSLSLSLTNSLSLHNNFLTTFHTNRQTDWNRQSKEILVKGKALYGWPPLYDSLLSKKEKYIISVLKGADLK